MKISAARGRAPINGFTLAEIAIVLLIIGILAAIAYPSYLDQVRKSRRAVAKSSLLDAANREEQYFFSHRQYGSLADLGYTSTYFGKDGSVGPALDAVYQLSVTAVNSGSGVCGSAPCFELQATPKNDQMNDTACGTFTLTSDNAKAAGGQDCW